jgi:hypothetical protein
MNACRLSIVALVLTGCGPIPVVRTYEQRPSAGSAGGRDIVATVENTSFGEGQIDVEAVLKEEHAAASYHVEKKVHLGPHESVVVTLHAEAPEGAYISEVKAVFPPR